MKNLLTPSRTLATCLLLGLGAGGAAAQTLGPVRADASIGRPLDITVPATFVADDARGECVHADVFFGDQKLPPGQVRASVIGAPQQRRVRVETNAAIDEPVVTVAVRAGCGSTVSRSYTLLPDVPSEAVLAALAGRSAQPGGVMSTTLASAPSAPLAPPSLAPARLSTQVAGNAPARIQALRPAVARAPEAAPRARPIRVARLQEAATGPARLKLENWEPDAQTMLRVTSYLGQPAQDSAARATAALLWQAINADPTDLLRTAASIQKLEGELTQLRQGAGQTRADMAALRQRLESPPAPLASTRLAQFLAFLLLLAGGTAGYLWWRNQRAGEVPTSWSGAPLDSSLDSALPPQDTAPQPLEQPAPQAFAPVAEKSAALPVAGAGAASVLPAPVPPERPAVRPTRPAGPAQVRPNRAEAATMLRVETLAATFEEVEFLCSLGLWNDAMDVLKTYLEDSNAPAPLAFFELMRLSVNTDDAAMLVAVRKRYAQVYGKDAPKFEQINSPLGLESFPELASRVTRAWGTPEALDLIELSLFTVPPAGKAISLQAGRDLLCLHDLAMALVRDSGGDPASEADGHALAPWANLDDPQQAAAAVHGAAESVGGHRFALDLDLGPAGEELPDSQPAELDSGLMREFENLRNAQAAPKAPAPAPSPAETDHEDAFSAVMASEKRRAPAR